MRERRLLMALNLEEEELIEAAAVALGWTKSEFLRFTALKFVAQANYENAEKAKANGDTEAAEHCLQVAKTYDAAVEKVASVEHLRDKSQKHYAAKKSYEHVTV